MKSTCIFNWVGENNLFDKPVEYDAEQFLWDEIIRQTISACQSFYYCKPEAKTMYKTIGMLLLAIGIIMLVWTGFTYTKKEKVIDAGPIQVSADKEHTVNWPPYAGGILVIAGIVLLLNGNKNR